MYMYGLVFELPDGDSPEHEVKLVKELTTSITKRGGRVARVASQSYEHPFQGSVYHPLTGKLFGTKTPEQGCFYGWSHEQQCLTVDGTPRPDLENQYKAAGINSFGEPNA